MRREMRDDGQLMMLAGIVLTISFILTALTLSQVSALEREAAAETRSPVTTEWRFLHERLGSNLKTAIGPETTIESFKTTILPTVQATFRSVESEKGYDLTIRQAGGALYAAPGNEAQLCGPAPAVCVVGGNYNAWTWDGRVRFTHVVSGDVEDGILWQSPCPDTSVAACIGGVYVHIRMTDGVATMDESVLFATNQ